MLHILVPSLGTPRTGPSRPGQALAASAGEAVAEVGRWIDMSSWLDCQAGSVGPPRLSCRPRWTS